MTSSRFWFGGVDEEVREDLLRMKAELMAKSRDELKAAAAVTESHIMTHGAAVPPSPPADEDGELFVFQGQPSRRLRHVAVGVPDGIPVMHGMCTLVPFVGDEFRAEISRWKARAYREREKEKKAALAVAESQLATHSAALPSSPPAEEDGEHMVTGQTSGGLGAVAVGVPEELPIMRGICIPVLLCR